MDSVWREIISEALEQLIARAEQPVAGAKLRNAVAQTARDRALQFPPEGAGKFSELIEAFPADFIVQRHPGHDLLVVPAARAELLAAESPRSATAMARMRQDLFDAFTRITDESWGLPWYDPDRDRVLYVQGDNPPPRGAVPMPITTLDHEKALRSRFIDEIDLPESTNTVLRDAVSSTATPLRDFANQVQEFGLAKRWHTFRLAYLATRLREWSVGHALTWQPSWIEAGESRVTTSSVLSVSVSDGVSQQLAQLASSLTKEDLGRINVPLDIVLRLMAKR